MYLVVDFQQSAECLEVVVVDLIVEFEVRLADLRLLFELVTLDLETSVDGS